jgi:RNA polymerase sigma-70 factor (ECF subfamily)
LLFERYFASVHRYISQRLGPDLADDLAAETFVVAFEGRASYDPLRPDARPWLLGIATNLVHEQLPATPRNLALLDLTAPYPNATLDTDPQHYYDHLNGSPIENTTQPEG